PTPPATRSQSSPGTATARSVRPRLTPPTGSAQSASPTATSPAAASPTSSLRTTRRTPSASSRTPARPVLAPVSQNRHAVGERRSLGELQPLRLARVAEQALARSQQDREDHEPQLVHQVLLDQRLNEVGAAGDQDVALVLIPQLAYLVRDVTANDGRVVPLRFVERRRDDVLRHRVH